MAPEKRLAMLFDDGQYQTIELPKTIVDPLRFRDRKRYADRLKEAQAERRQSRRAAGGARHASAARRR